MLKMTAVLLLSIPAALVAADHPFKPATEGAKTPEAAVAAVAEKWKVERLAERMSDPDSVWQTDVFWELLKLCETNEQARGDANVEALLSWQLLDAALWQKDTLADPVYGKIPVLLPKLGRKILLKRLDVWMLSIGAQQTGLEPWLWPEFKLIDSKALLAAILEMSKNAPQHDPAPRVWIAAARLACNDEEGPQELAAARDVLKKDLPLKGNAVYGGVLDTLLNAGIRNALPLMLQEAQQSTEKDSNNNARPYAEVYQFLGWRTPPAADAKAELTKVQAWLNPHLSELVWDPRKRCYSCDAAPPGLESSYAFARNIEMKFGLKCTQQLMTRFDGGQSNTLVQQLIQLMGSRKEAASDPDVTGLLSELLAAQPYDQWLRNGMKDALTTALPQYNADYAAELLAVGISKTFAANQEPEGLFQQLAQPRIPLWSRKPARGYRSISTRPGRRRRKAATPSRRCRWPCN